MIWQGVYTAAKGRAGMSPETRVGPALMLADSVVRVTGAVHQQFKVTVLPLDAKVENPGRVSRVPVAG